MNRDTFIGSVIVCVIVSLLFFLVVGVINCFNAGWLSVFGIIFGVLLTTCVCFLIGVSAGEAS